MQMPEPDKATLARRGEIVAALRAIVPGEGVIDAPEEMKPYESDGLTAYRTLPMIVVLPSTTAQVADVLRRRHLAVRRGAAAGRWRAAGAGQVQPRARHRL